MDYSTPSGYYPQLPITCTGKREDGKQFFVSGTIQADCPYLLHVSLGIDEKERNIVRDEPFPSSDAAKAYCLSHGYSVPWSYLGTGLHAKAVTR